MSFHRQDNREDSSQGTINHKQFQSKGNEFSSDSSNDDMGSYREPRSSNGLTGFVKNPYVFFTAIFASIGGILFGCKSLLVFFLYSYY